MNENKKYKVEREYSAGIRKLACMCETELEARFMAETSAHLIKDVTFYVCELAGATYWTIAAYRNDDCF